MPLGAQISADVQINTCACRYFAPPEATDALKGSTLRSAKFALGPSFGTLSLGSLVLTLIELARQALQQ